MNEFQPWHAGHAGLNILVCSVATRAHHSHRQDPHGPGLSAKAQQNQHNDPRRWPLSCHGNMLTLLEY